jgi:hypothetical protein
MGRCRVNAGAAGLAVFAQGTAVRRIETRSGSTRKRNSPVRRSRMRPKFASTQQ